MTFSIPPKTVPSLPRTEAEIALAAAVIGLSVPEACMAGVVANIALLAHHAAILGDVPQDQAS